MKTILITGSAGFIGYHLAKKLLTLSYKVVCVDNLNDYYEQELKYARLADLGVPEKYSKIKRIYESPDERLVFVNADITDSKAMEELFKTYNFRVVCNLAAQAGVRYSLESPKTYIDSNIVGFFNILDLSKRFNIDHLIYASSSSVYGQSDNIPFAVDDPTDLPISLYAATKKANEVFAHSYSHLYKLATTGLRFFTVYGPWGRPDMAPMLFAKAAVEGRPISVYNHGDMLRDFTYVDDIISGIILILENPPKGDIQDTPYRIFNLGNSSPVKLLDFIEQIELNLEVKVKKDFKPLQKGDALKTWADISAIECLGYKPKTSVEIGVQKFIAWYKNYYLR